METDSLASMVPAGQRSRPTASIHAEAATSSGPRDLLRTGDERQPPQFVAGEERLAPTVDPDARDAFLGPGQIPPGPAAGLRLGIELVEPLLKLPESVPEPGQIALDAMLGEVGASPIASAADGGEPARNAVDGQVAALEGLRESELQSGVQHGPHARAVRLEGHRDAHVEHAQDGRGAVRAWTPEEPLLLALDV